MKKLLLMLLLGTGLSMVGQTKVLLSAAGEKVPYTPIPRGNDDQYIKGDHTIGDFTVANTLVGKDLTTTVNGVTGAPVDLTDLLTTSTVVSNSSTANIATVTVNGVTSTGAPIVNTVVHAVSGTTLTTTINGIDSNGIDLSGAISGGITNDLVSLGNDITSTVNGSASTATIVNTIDSQITNNTELAISVNGVADSTPLDLSPIVNAVVAKQVIEEFTVGTAGQTAFTLGTAARASTPAKIYVNGVKVQENALTVTGTAAVYNNANNYTYALQVDDIVTIAYME